MKSSMLSNSLYRRATTECWFTFFLCTTLISSFQFQNVVRHKNVPSIPRTKSQLFSSKKDDNDNVNDRKHNTATDMKRRNLFLFTTTTFSTLLLPNNIVFADDSPLFKKNPLLNPLLEQIRIWEQAEADNIKYGGELERGDAGNKGQVDSYPKLLVPILQISNDINQIDLLIKQQQNSKNENDQTAKYLYYEEVITILNKSIYGKIPFKQIFNAYADNIYYSDPDRANLYLAGGATPKIEQSLAYLLRNDILTNIENLQAEVPYIIKHPEESTNDMNQYIVSAKDAMQRYLDVVPRNELLKAKELLSLTSS